MFIMTFAVKTWFLNYFSFLFVHWYVANAKNIEQKGIRLL